uniref:uncharacterized protein LOC122582052 n=1 Tax=Erigeron canadensis TaxID=72917 RepID=UPI001CB9CB21|nr:uncharacterized protein LOC122582052 [Erigeron canadensis]
MGDFNSSLNLEDSFSGASSISIGMREFKDCVERIDVMDVNSTGPDGFNLVFFKESWNVVGSEVCMAVQEFFRNGKILRELNHTIISLIPKVPTPSGVNDYRSISCCNVLYKCISKIITNRIKDALDDLVDINQSAFVCGRRISDNILLTQELMHDYHRKVGPPRCAFKIDI